MSIEETLSLILKEVQALKQPSRPEDKLLSAKEAGKMLDVKPGFMYLHAKEFPFTVILSDGEKRTIKFSYNRLQKWIETKLKLQEGK